MRDKRGSGTKEGARQSRLIRGIGPSSPTETDDERQKGVL
jgi:hypothetical protein